MYYALIAIIFVSGSGGAVGTAVVQQEFQSFQVCEQARTKLTTSLPFFSKVASSGCYLIRDPSMGK